MSNSLWVQKYRPQTLEELCLPAEIKNRFASGQVDAHLLFGGHQGTGKTSLAKILTKNHTTLFINGSEERSIDVVRKKIIEFCSTNSILNQGKIKVVNVDEGEKFTKDAQDALKAVVEKYERNARFLFTSNFPERLDERLRSRFEYIPFNVSDNEVIDDLKIQYIKRLMFILKAEKYTIEREAMMHLVNNGFPDLRNMTVMLYAASRKVETGGKITLEMIQSNIIRKDVGLYEFLCTAYTPEQIFYKIKGEYLGRERDVLKSLGEPFLEYLINETQYASKVLTISMMVHKYNYEISTGDVDPLITLLACCSAISQVLK